jgi:hypothetical protein
MCIGIGILPVLRISKHAHTSALDALTSARPLALPSSPAMLMTRGSRLRCSVAVTPGF